MRTDRIVRAVLAAGLAAALGSSHAAADGPPDATELNNRGVTAARAGRFAEGAAWLRQALEASPNDATARRNLSGVLADWARQPDRHADPEAVSALLEEAVALDPDNGLVWTQLGDWRYLRTNDLEGAIRAWEQAFGHVPAAIAQALSGRVARAQRDALVARGFVAHTTAHCVIRLEEQRAADVEPLAQLLEAHYARLATLLGGGPARLTVLVYSGDDLQRVATRRDWAMGLYDGRIRLQVTELTQPYLEDMVAHELAHAFLHDRFGHGLPTWLHEGFAQLQERGREPDETIRRIEDGLRARRDWVPLRWLDRRFDHPTHHEDVWRAYVESRLAVEGLLAHGGPTRLVALMRRLGRGEPIETAYDALYAPSTWARADRGVFD